MIVEAAMSDLGQYLRKEIEGRGWSIRAAARNLGLSFATFYGVLTKPGTPELPTLQKISEGLGVPLKRLQELAGFAFSEDSPRDDPLFGLTDEQRARLASLSPERKRALIDLIARLLD